MGKSQRDKGNRIERAIVNALKALDLRCERVPLSGASHYQGRNHDIDLYLPGDDAPLCGEVKGRRRFPAWLSSWLSDNDFLVMKADHCEPLVVVPWRIWRKLVQR